MTLTRNVPATSTPVKLIHKETKLDASSETDNFLLAVSELASPLYIEVKGQWKYLYRAVDKQGSTLDFLLTARRDKTAAKRFFDKAIRSSGAPEKINMDKNCSNKVAADGINETRKQRKRKKIILRQIKYLNNIVEQDHRGIKSITRRSDFPTSETNNSAFRKTSNS